MNRKNEQGFIAALLSVVLVFGGLWLLLCLRFSTTEQLVSGIVYNNTNNSWPSGNTRFSVRASTDTYVNESNESSYCLPPGSPYIGLVNKAAADKNVKVVVKTSKMFEIVGNPFVCVDNVTVELAK